MLPTITGVMPPRDDVPRSKKKEEEWGLQAARFVYSALFSSHGLFNLSTLDSFRVWRSYGNGEQDTTGLANWFTDGGDTTSSPRISANGTDAHPRTGKDIVRGKRVFTQIAYDVVGPMPKIKSILISICTQSSYRIKCSSINPAHVQQRAQEAYLAYYRASFVKQQSQKYGIAYTPSLIAPTNLQQLEILRKAGYFRLKFESGFQDLIQHTFNISNWKQIEQKTIEDGGDIGFKCGKIFNDYKTGATKVKYIDPALFVIQWNSQHEGKDPTFVGHIERMKMYQVSEMMVANGYDTRQAMEAAKAYAMTTNNAFTSSNAWDTKDAVTGRWLWEDLEVDVMEFEYMTNDSYRMAENDNGEYAEIENPNHKYEKQYETCVVYAGKYIVGTDVVLDFGPAVNNDGYFTYFWDRIPGLSITRRCIGLLDDLMKLVTKWRAEVKAAAPSGYYLDITAVANLSMNVADQQEFIQQAVAAHRQTGILTGQSITRQGKTVNNDPIRPLANGPQNLGIYEQGIATTLFNILDVAGIPTILAATPTQDKGKAVRIGEQEVISGNHALFLQKESVWRFKEFAAKIIIRQIRLDIFSDPLIAKYYEGIIDPDQYLAIKAVENLPFDELTTELESLPTKVERENLKIRIAEAAMAGTRDGLKTLVESDLMFIDRLIDADQTEVAEIYASNVIESRLAEYAAKAPEADARNKAMQMELLAAKEASEIRVIDKKIQLEGMVKANLQQQKGIIDSQLQAEGSEQEKEEMRVEALYENITGKNIRNNE